MLTTGAFASTATPCGEKSGDVTSGSSANCWACGDNCVARLDSSGKMTVSGSGTMTNYSSYRDSNNREIAHTTAPWDSQRESITTLEVEYGITNIGGAAFVGTNISNLTLPNSITRLEDNSFWHNYSLTSVTLPDSLKEIGRWAFQEAIHLQSITIPDSVTKIEAYAFQNTRALTDVNFGENSQLDSIGIWAFWDTPSLTSIVVPESVTNIHYRAFESNALENIYCTQEQISSGVCTSTKFQGFGGNIVHYESEGNHYNIYDSSGNIVAQYKNAADFGTTRTYQRRTSYTPAEAAQHLNHTNNNNVIFTFK